MSLQDFIAANAAEKPPRVVATATMYGDEMELGFENLADITCSAELEIQALEVAEDQATSLQASMESLHNYVVSAKAEGSMRPEAIEMTLGLYNQLTEPYAALRAEDFEVPSFESINVDGAQTALTEYAAENIGETVTKAIETIKRLVRAAIKAAVKFYDQHVALAGRVGKNADTVKKAVSNIKEDAVQKETELKFSGMKYLFVGKEELIGHKDIIKFYRQVEDAGDKALEVLKVSVKELGDMDLEKESAVTEVQDKISKAMADVGEVFTVKGLENAIASAAGISDETGDILRRSVILPGGEIIVVKTNPNTGEVKVTHAPIQGHLDEIKKIAVLDREEIKGASSEATEVLVVHGRVIKKSRLIAERSNNVLVAMDSLAKKAKESNNEKAIAEVEKVIKDIQPLLKSLRQPFIGLCKNMAQYANAKVQYGKASVRNYGKKKD